MKTSRFSSIVDKCGKPEVHLALVEPSKDKALQSAARAHRVLTVIQENVGTKTDRGTIGLVPGKNRQFLIFPKSLRSFEGSSVVGIKYDQIEEEKAPSKKAVKPVKARQKEGSKAKKPIHNYPNLKPIHESKPEHPPASNVVKFKPEEKEDTAENEEVADLKKLVRKAMALLEGGKEVAAFNVLKRIVNG